MKFQEETNMLYEEAKRSVNELKEKLEEVQMEKSMSGSQVIAGSSTSLDYFYPLEPPPIFSMSPKRQSSMRDLLEGLSHSISPNQVSYGHNRKLIILRKMQKRKTGLFNEKLRVFNKEVQVGLSKIHR